MVWQDIMDIKLISHYGSIHSRAVLMGMKPIGYGWQSTPKGGVDNCNGYGWQSTPKGGVDNRNGGGGGKKPAIPATHSKPSVSTDSGSMIALAIFVLYARCSMVSHHSHKLPFLSEMFEPSGLEQF